MFRQELFRWCIHPTKVELGLAINFASARNAQQKATNGERFCATRYSDEMNKTRPVD
jgi:hypothetical protein